TLNCSRHWEFCSRFWSGLRINRFGLVPSMALSQSKSDPANAEEFYKKAEEFWSNASRDIDGMLGGFANLHVPDIRASKSFIKKLRDKKFLVENNRAADCGAGIGRVTRHLLLPLFKNVVMVEPVGELLEKSVSYVGQGNVTRVQVGLQNFYPDPSTFDMIWIQWCSGHLTDSDMVNFLSRCIEGLTDDGVIVFKDNLSAQQESEFDCEDYSWTRPEALVLELFDRAGLRVVAENLQTGFPSGMYKVKMFALKPVANKYAKAKPEN
uniref:Alpha N-terminal protein methyltransferase 1 n=1 Tax=Haemonchus contortus TaxID=6289 RepID=A0A7I4YQI8_HAECO